MTKSLWVYCLSPVFSKTCTFLHFYILSNVLSFQIPSPIFPTFFPPPTPISTNLVCNLKASIIYELSLVVLFDVLPSTSTTTGMTLILLMFHNLLISLFSSQYLSIFPFSFLLTLMSPGIAISTILQLRSFSFTTKPSLVHFQKHLLEHVHTTFHFFQVVFPILFPMNYSCNIIMLCLVLLLYQLFTFAHNMRYCFTFLVTHSIEW